MTDKNEENKNNILNVDFQLKRRSNSPVVLNPIEHKEVTNIVSPDNLIVIDFINKKKVA